MENIVTVGVIEENPTAKLTIAIKFSNGTVLIRMGD
jgi:hypothetical protein